eukprot:maker-scaffold564_size136232-snap-gene-0.37 protein:Tk11654 transcript:maker-scaffold564_size136232-snap-gene-0.37-mRNA-1 annotation:"PREDICTED: uncharacterized protein K02A2.6-like"
MVMKNLHESHQGIHRTRSRARNLYYWPRLNNDIAQPSESCDEWQEYKPSQIREAKIGHWIPDRPFQAISADFSIDTPTHFPADALSRPPVDEADKCIIDQIVCLNAGIQDNAIKKFIEACRADSNHQELYQALKSSVCLKTVPRGHHMKQYQKVWSQ